MADRYPVIGICRSAYIVWPQRARADGPRCCRCGERQRASAQQFTSTSEPWRPRDMLLARWPAQTHNNAQKKRRKPRAEGVDQQRLTVYVEPATYVETRLYFERDLTRSLEDENKNRFGPAPTLGAAPCRVV